jgi:hypothetical protein
MSSVHSSLSMTYTPVPYFMLGPSPHLPHAPPLPYLASIPLSVPELSWPCLAVLSVSSNLELTTWTWVLLEKRIVSQSPKKFPAFCGIWRFITTFTRTCQFWARWIEFTPSHPISLRSSLLSSHLFLRLPRNLFPSGLETRNLYGLLSYTCYMNNISYLTLVHKNKLFHGSSSKSRSATSFTCEVLG